MKILLLGLFFLSSSLSFAEEARFRASAADMQALIEMRSAQQCSSFLTRLSWKAETSVNHSEIASIARTIRIFQDSIAPAVCPVQEFNSAYLILKMDEMIGFVDSHPGISLKSFAEIRTAIQEGRSL